MNRETRIRSQIPSASDELVTALAAKPAAEVDLIVAALRQARRDALAHEAERKRQRKLDDRKHGNYDESQLADRNLRLIRKTGERAVQDLDALASLAMFRRHADHLERVAVESLRAQGVSDPEIGRALGVTRDAVGQRFGRRGSSTRDRAS